ncbi:hypothetical protein NUM3379_11330 [Kineococcus sp. NUM-3379]
MTNSTDTAATDAADGAALAAEAAPRSGNLSALRLPQLQELASQLGISGTGRMRKVDLLSAIREHQAALPGAAGAPAPRSGRRATAPAGAAEAPASAPVVEAPREEAAAPAVEAPRPDVPAAREEVAAPAAARNGSADPAVTIELPPVVRTEQDERRAGGEAPVVPTLESLVGDRPVRTEGERPSRRERSRRGERNRDGARDGAREGAGDLQQQLPVVEPREGGDREPRADRPDREPRGEREPRADRGEARQDRTERGGADRGGLDRAAAADRGPDRGVPDDDEGGRRGRRSRYRDRKQRRGGRPEGAPETEPEIGEDDVLLPVAGILDVLDNYAFVRTSGYLPGANDVYVSLGQVKKHGLRKGDAVTGAVRQPRDNEQQNQRAKFNALVRVDSVNGASPDDARRRPDFNKLTPLYPQDRLRLETEHNVLTTRIIDLMSPIGKGQRGLIVSPPKAGKTMVLQAIANAITTNNPECHLMVVLVDERPEEVTDMQRTVKGEVIASTFDRPADDHTTVAELAIERAKRLVELGNDVVVLLDSITRLGRAYNLAAPASGRIMSGGVDSSALYPPKRFFGAARNIENGGSLTILATALVDTGSKADEVIFEEFKGTGNMELRLSRQLADKRIFPAVDVPASGTRREEILMSREELQIVWKLRRVVTALDPQQAIELMLDRLKKTRNNLEFLMTIQKTTPSVGQGGDDA